MGLGSVLNKLPEDVSIVQIICATIYKKLYYGLFMYLLTKIMAHILSRKNRKIPWSESASELYRPSDRPLSAK
jgi:hypothetical protein